MGVPPGHIFTGKTYSTTLPPVLFSRLENRIGYKSTLRINAFLRLDKNLVCDHLLIVDGNCVTQTGFAKSRPAAQGTLHGPRTGVHIPRSSLEFWSAVFYSACSDLCSKMEEGEFSGFFAIAIVSIPAILVSFCCFLLKEQNKQDQLKEQTRSLLYTCVLRYSYVPKNIHVHVPFFVKIEIAKKPKLTSSILEHRSEHAL